MGDKIIDTTGSSKKIVSQGGFFNSKNITSGSSVDQYKKTPSFWPIGQKMLILHENLELSMARENFPLKKATFWQMSQKDGEEPILEG